MNLSFKMLLAIATVVVVTASSGQVEAGCGAKSCCKLVNSCCPNCNYCCKLDAEVVDVSKTCFEVECETICIPRVVFPWQTGDFCFPFCGKKKKARSTCDSCNGRGCIECNNCVHNGAKLRTIKKLKTKKYTCPECEYTWRAEEIPCAACCENGKCCGAACDGACGGCDAGSDGAAAPADQPQTLPAPTYQEQQSAGLAPTVVQ